MIRTPIFGQKEYSEDAPEYDSFVTDEEELAYTGHEKLLTGKASTLSAFNSDDEPKVRYSMHQTRSVSLDISNLRFVPARGYVREGIDQTVKLLRIKKLFPNMRELSNNPRTAPLQNVSFCVPTHRLTAIIGTNLSEQKTLIDLISGRRNAGEYGGEIVLNGLSEESFYSDKMAFAPSRTVSIPGFTFLEAVQYAARLRLSHLKVNISIDARVREVLAIMGLRDCQNRIIPEFPQMRGELGRDLRLLSIAVEIVTLPPLIIIDDPVLSLEPGVAVKILDCLNALTQRGHIVLCSVPKLNPILIPQFRDVVVLSEGYSIYSASIASIEKYYCSNIIGYKLNRGVDLFSFLLDIASGTERPSSRRAADTPQTMQEKFEASKFYLHPEINPRSLSAFSKELFFLFGYGSVDSPVTIMFRAFVTIERAFMSKYKDVETFKRSFGGSVILGLLVGYLQFNQGSYGYYTMTLAQYPYFNTANVTALLFFVSIFVFTQQLLNAHIICRKVHLFLYEQRNKCSSTSAFFIATLLSEVPLTIFYTWIFSSIVYFMADLNKGFENYLFFVYLLAFEACIGLLTTILFASVLRDEIAVRDVFFACTFMMVMLSGFPFQLSFMSSFISSMTTINPTRYTFEALMSWKFAEYYADGYYYLIPFSFQDFNPQSVFQILQNFALFASLLSYLALFPRPMLLKKIEAPLDRTESTSVASPDGSFQHSIDSVANSLVETMSLPRMLSQRTSESSTVKPLIFARESSITSKSRLSISAVSQSIGAKGKGSNDSRGPTVAFRDLTYKVKDRRSPMGYKTVINNVSGQFDWGKLNCIMGASQSGKSSLLHIIAGDIGPRTNLQGIVYYNKLRLDSSIPLWQRCALVESRDEQYVFLTVRETVTFAMKLRCVAGEMDLDLVGESTKGVLETLHLDGVADKKVKYLTPGERRRLSIAEEIVHGPSLLLIDEPTTDLNPLDESVMMMTFREMVNQDRTVVASVHQPSPNAFKLFDKILLLSKGRVIYHGSASGACKYFITCPYMYDFSSYQQNPGEFLLDISSGLLKSCTGDILESSALEDYYRNTEGYKSFLANLITYYNGVKESATSIDSASVSGIDSKLLYDSFSPPNRSSIASSRRVAFFFLFYSVFDSLSKLQWKDVVNFFRCSWIIFHRASLALANRWGLIVASIVGHILLAALFGWIIGDCSDELYNSTSYFAVSTLFLMMFNLQFIFYIFKSNEVFLKEHSRGLYSNLNQWIFSSLPLYLLRTVNAIFFSLVAYSILNLNQESDIYGYYVLSNILVILASTMMSEAIVYIVPDIRSAYVLIPGITFLQFVFSGLFLKAASLPSWLGPFAPSISLIRWAMQGNFINLFEYNTSVFPPNNVYNFYTAFLTLFGWGGKTREYCLWMIITFCAVFKLSALIIMIATSYYQQGGRSFKKLIENFNE